MIRKTKIRVLEIESSLRRYIQGEAKTMLIALFVMWTLLSSVSMMTGDFGFALVNGIVVLLVATVVVCNFNGHKHYVIDVDGETVDFWSPAKTREELLSEVLYRMRKQFPQKYVTVGDVIEY